MTWRFGCVALVMAAAIGPLPGFAQTELPESPPITVDGALLQMSARAGVIFAGQVVAIRRSALSPQTNGRGAGFVEIEFRVDQALRGCSQGQSYVVREWAGLWEGGTERYHVGQRRLMLLHAAGPGGLSSPVNGMQGAIPIVPGTAALVPQSQAWHGEVVENTAPPPMNVDLRWIDTGVYRAVSPALVRAPGAQAMTSGPLQSRAEDDPQRLAVEDRALTQAGANAPRTAARLDVSVPAVDPKAAVTGAGIRPLHAVLQMLAGEGAVQRATR